ncbi:choice-of-anchor B family protein [Alteromonas oceanisediminis]|uniref:choice-of-anchor B family protein n=1 Tax=Alteromonas oceanisediminis TaxID=2836180 RepID=UPI001BDB37E9|nr:choice-of-anchor B family protein [Alteromonas oceanisediminis]MBT0585108.1 choice-of-anchor B family protein [Alteromonas oceanisediminis]
MPHILINPSKARQHLRTLGVMVLVMVSGALSPNLHAHSEKEKARFVAQNGIDSGACNNRFRPCRSIAYAVQQANKGDKILVAEGTYPITSEQELLYLVSELQPVLGGFNTLDNYQVQQPSQFKSTLTGVPPAYAETLYNKGFHVIADGKNGVGESVEISLNAIRQMNSSHAAAACVDGQSEGFECRNISMVAHVPLSALPTNSTSANDIWGHVDLNDMREYALIGLRRGVAVLDVTDAQNPTVVGSVSGQSTTWRDIKVYQYYSTSSQRWKAYAYAGADSVTEGLTIIDLTNLPNSISLDRRTQDDRLAHNVYISNVDYTTNTALTGRDALLHVTGTNNFGGSWRTFSLRNPQAPHPAYQLDGATRFDYTHDASSLLINDARATRDCVNGSSDGCSVMLDFNENELRLWDHTESNSATELGSETYPNAAYVHSGWWSEDKQYVILHDELDEQNSGLNTTVHFFDISDLNSPTLVASWEGPTRAIDHNGFTRGNRYYMSNYERGLTILDISDPLAPEEIGYFDTFPSSNNPSFNGNWGVYPYLPSGNILASDIQGGLYILRDETLDEDAAKVGFANTQFSINEGQTASFEVVKSGNGAMSVDYHIIEGSARSNDFDASAGTLSWSASETAPKTITIEAIADSGDETDEVFFVRLSNPVGGAIVNKDSTSFVTIPATGLVRGVVGFQQESLIVKETDGTITVDVARTGGADESLKVNYALTNGEAVIGGDIESATGSLLWGDGDSADKTISLTLIDDTESEPNESITLALSASNTALLSGDNQLTLTIRDDESNQPPTANAGNDLQVNTRQSVTLVGSASDAESDVEVSWAQTSGPSVTLNFSDTDAPTFTAPNSASMLIFELTVTDDFGLTATDTATVTVNAPVSDNASNNSSSGGGALNMLSMLWVMLILAIRQYRCTSILRAAQRD